MGALFSKPKLPAMPEPPDEDSAAVLQASIDAKKRGSLAKGRSKSILGGSMDTGRVQPKRLLGE